MKDGLKLPVKIDQYRQLQKYLGQFSEKTSKQIIADLGRTDIFFLLVFILGRKDAFRQYILDRCREYQAEPWGYLDLWARMHYKSTIITIAYRIFEMINEPELCHGIFSYTKKISKEFLKQIKRELEQNALLKSLYPDIFYQNPEKQAPLWSENEGIIIKRRGNPKEATVEAWGVAENQPVSKHFNRMIYDDLVSLDTVNTPEQILKTIDGFKMSVALGSPGYKRAMIGTFYAHNDPYIHLIEHKTVKARIHKAMTDPLNFNSSVLLEPEELIKTRAEMGPAVFATQMLLDPSIQSGVAFKKEWLKYYPGGKQEQMNYVMVVDPSKGRNVKSDFTSIFIIGYGRDKNYYITAIIRDRLSLSQRTDLVFELFEQYEPLACYYEEYGLQADIEHIESEQIRRNYRFPIIPLGGAMPKKNRILRLQPDFESGRIYLPTTYMHRTVLGEIRDMVKDFISEEYLNFPAVDHDDALDCLARIYDIPQRFPLKRNAPAASNTDTNFYIS